MENILHVKEKFLFKLGDCIKGMEQIGPQAVDVVVTSPPYNIGKSYNSYADNLEHGDYITWCSAWAKEILRVIKSDGSFFLNIGSSSGRLLFPFEVAKVMENAGFVLQNTIHWIKSISIDREQGADSYGHFKPINSNRFLNDCQEYVFHFTTEGNKPLDRLAIGVPYADKSNIARWGHTNGMDKRCRGNTWFIPYKTITLGATQRPHPATFPTELAVKCIRLHGKPNAVVMDPFLGIGHAAYAAKACADMVSQFIGFEIDEEYLRLASHVIGCGYSKVNRKSPRPLFPSGA